MSTSLETKNRSIDEMLTIVSSTKNFIERVLLEEMIDELVDSVEESQRQTVREFGYDLLVSAAAVDDLVISKSRAIDVLLDIRNSGLV